MAKPEQIYKVSNLYGSAFFLHNMSVVFVQHAERNQSAWLNRIYCGVYTYSKVDVIQIRHGLYKQM